MVEMAMYNVQRAIAPKVGRPELRSMCSARCLIVLYICVKFGENILGCIRVMEQTQMMEVLMNGRTLKFSDGITIPTPQKVAGHNFFLVSWQQSENSQSIFG